jgi:Ca2+-transporting ATPase
MIDPARPEVRDAVEVCREAGIRPVMITGDHIVTAEAIAKDLGILRPGDVALEGKELERMSDAELLLNIEKYSVYARVSPAHKVRIVKAWKLKGKVTAMTGDGVNDAPALKAADISIGMGITGTDVAKGVSDIILVDDNFATIVSAVKEGRKIYNNIKKVIHFLLSTHLGEVVTLFIATLFNWVILFPIHLLWVNLIIDTLPALALGMEKADKGIMQEKPASPDQKLFANGLGFNIIFHGMMKGILVLAAYLLARNIHGQDVAVTTAFATLGLVQLAHALSLRSKDFWTFSTKLPINKYLVAAVMGTAAMQVIVIVVPVDRTSGNCIRRSRID